MTREMAIEELQRHRQEFAHDHGWSGSVLDALDAAIEALQKEQRTGHWINAKVGRLFPSNDFKCSECGNILNFDGVNCGRGDANFCPNCGAKMEEGE